MITNVTNDKCYEFRGKSSDVKPVDRIGNGSVFLEMDTGEVFLFDEETKT